MTFARRDVLKGAALAAPFVLTFPTFASAAGAARRFTVLRGDEDIGFQETAVRVSGDRVEATQTARLAVKRLGITLYRYELDAVEVWQGGRLISLEGEANDDGDRETCAVRREGDRLVSSGTWQGELPGDAAPTSYWAPEFLSRGTWISTQSGAPLSITTARQGPAEAPVAGGGATPATRWRVSGDIDLQLYYSDAGEWIGSAFDAQGETARFLPQTTGQRLAPLFPAA